MEAFVDPQELKLPGFMCWKMLNYNYYTKKSDWIVAIVLRSFSRNQTGWGWKKQGPAIIEDR